MVSGPLDDMTPKSQTLGFDHARLDRIGDWMARYVAQGEHAGRPGSLARGGRQVGWVMDTARERMAAMTVAAEQADERDQMTFDLPAPPDI